MLTESAIRDVSARHMGVRRSAHIEAEKNVAWTQAKCIQREWEG